MRVPFVYMLLSLSPNVQIHRHLCLQSFLQSGARKTGPPSRRPTWAQVSDSVQEIKTNANAKYLLVREGAENDLLVCQCTFVHAAAHCNKRDATQRCQFSELTPLSCVAFMTICCSVHKSALTYKEIIFSTFSNQ